MRQTQELLSKIATPVTKPLIGMFFGVVFVTWTQAESVANLLTDGDFDNLAVGTAPDDPGNAGQWQFFPDFPEVYQEQYSIVATSSFDPNADPSGKSLRVRGALSSDYNLDSDVDGYDFLAWQRSGGAPEGPVDWQNDYGKFQNAGPAHLANALAPIHEGDNMIIRVNFDVFVPTAITPGDAAIYLGGDHSGLGDDYPEGAWQYRGPQIRWDREGNIYAAGWGGPDKPVVRETLVKGYETDRWQQVQIDADLARDTFDFYHAPQGEPLTLIASDVGFRVPNVQLVDTLVVARFSNNLAGGSIYFDNVNVAALPMSASLSQAVPEPTTLMLLASTFPLLLSQRKRLR